MYPGSVQAQTINPKLSRSVWFASLPLDLRAVGTLGDFDGDRRPDLAIARPDGMVNGSYRYLVEVWLTAERAGSFVVDSASAGGLHISARDIDGDRDLDLVITSEVGRTPVGIWINDGHGRFTQGLTKDYPESVWPELGQEFDRPEPPSRTLSLAACGSGETRELTRSPRPLACDKQLPFPAAADSPATAWLNPGNPFRAPPVF